MIIHYNNNYSNAGILGVDSRFLKVANEHLIKGRAFRKQDINSKRTVAIIGQTTAKDLFGKSNSVLSKVVGKEFRIGQ